MSVDAWLSFIEYRPDPSEPERDKIVLGCITQVQRDPHHQDYSLFARVELTEAERVLMDGIGRETLARPTDFLVREFRRILQESLGTLPREEGGGLRILSEEFLWSLRVTAPRAIRIEQRLGQTKKQALLETTRDLLTARMLKREVPLSRTLRAGRIIPADWKEQVPAAWEIAHSSLAAPHPSPT